MLKEKEKILVNSILTLPTIFVKPACSERDIDHNDTSLYAQYVCASGYPLGFAGKIPSLFIDELQKGLAQLISLMNRCAIERFSQVGQW